MKRRSRPITDQSDFNTLLTIMLGRTDLLLLAARDGAEAVRVAEQPAFTCC